MADKPRFENAPGVVVRQRKDGSWVAFWQARSDLAKKGYRPATVPLWRGDARPSRADQVYVSDRCQRFQTEMRMWGGEGSIPHLMTFDGTIRGLIDCYRSDPDSTYHKARYRTREHYDSLIRRITRDLGDKHVGEIDARTLMRAHEGWAAQGHIAMAHSLVGMLRTLATFGATLLKNRDCRELKITLHDLRFSMAKPRTERLTSEHAIALRRAAHAAGLPEIALAQAIQFEGMLRQKDVIGEWVPMSEPGVSDRTWAGQKWLRGIRWNEIDDNLILRHTTSKRGKDVEIDLKLAPMVMEELRAIYGATERSALPASGPCGRLQPHGPAVRHKFVPGALAQAGDRRRHPQAHPEHGQPGRRDQRGDRRRGRPRKRPPGRHAQQYQHDDALLARGR